MYVFFRRKQFGDVRKVKNLKPKQYSESKLIHNEKLYM